MSQWSHLTGGLLLAEDCRIIEVNRTANRWLGYAEGELIGKSLHDFLGGGGQFFLQSQILPMLKLKGDLEEVYLRMKHQSGALVPILANIGFVSIPGPAKIEISFVRIAQRGRLEDELLLAKKLAEQASDAKTKFLGMMSHELRTPLQLISLNAQIVLEEALGPITSEQKETLEASQEALNSVVVIIDDILSFAQMEGGRVQVTIDDVPVEQALKRAETSIRHRVEASGLTFHGESDQGLTVRADPNRLQQVLVNLLNNAIKFTPRGGKITLRAKRDGEMIVFSVSDTGCGIPADQLQRVFEPFVQLRSTIESTDKPGVGLGLAICRDLASAMEGRMDVSSVVGVGSTFSIALPVARVAS
jgi:signal transduction histidine kinase